MEFDRESLMRFLSGKKVLLSLILIIISVLGLCIFTGVISTPWMDSLSCFDGPSYLPEGYLNVDNNTTNVDKTFVFQDNVGDSFMVGATNDLQKSELEPLKTPFEKDISHHLDLKEENLSVNGHMVVFQVLSVNFMFLNRNIFSASWFCNQTGLTVFVVGSMGSKDKSEMKKMVQSIQCHQEHKLDLSELKNVIIKPYLQ